MVKTIALLLLSNIFMTYAFILGAVYFAFKK